MHVQAWAVSAQSQNMSYHYKRMHRCQIYIERQKHCYWGSFAFISEFPNPQVICTHQCRMRPRMEISTEMN